MARLLAALRAQIRATSLPTVLFAALVGIVFCTLPGLNTPNYHAALFLALVLSLGVGPAAVRIGVQASTLSQAAKLGVVRLGPALLLPLGLLLLNGLRVRLCDVGSGLAFYLIGPLFSGLWAIGVGIALGFGFKRLGRGLMAFYGLFFLWLGWELWVIWSHPPIFVFNPYIGYFQGAIYDTVIDIEARYLWYRLNNLFQLASLWTLVWALKSKTKLAYMTLGGAGLATLVMGLLRGPIGYELHRDTIAQRLGGELQSERIRLIYDQKAFSVEQAQLLLQAHHYRLEQLDTEVGRTFPRQITAWVYGSTAQKRFLMGAGQVYIAKPWLDEIHLGPVSPDASVIKHELAHVVLSLDAPPLLHVPARLCVIPNMGLVEGAAEAFEWDTGSLSPHEWARALREVKRAPDLRKLLSPEGFYNQGSERAYTLTGSFIRYLIDRFGVEAFRDLYQDGDFERVYRVSALSLIADWEAYVDAYPLHEDAIALVSGRFHSQAIQHRPCGLDVAKTEAQAQAALSRKDVDEAIGHYQQVIDWIPEDASKKLTLLRVLSRHRTLPEVQAMYAAYLATKGMRNPMSDLDAKEALADALARAELWEQARELYTEIGTQPAQEARRRTTLVKLQLTQDRASQLILPFLLEGKGEALNQAGPHTGDAALVVAYLKARRLLNEGKEDASLALEDLLRMLVDGSQQADPKLGSPLDVRPWLLRETHAMLARSYESKGELARTSYHLEEAAKLSLYRGDAARLRDRAAFARWRLTQVKLSP